MAQVCMIVHQNYFRDGRVKRYVDTLLQSGLQVDVIGLSSSDYDDHPHTDGLRVYTLPMKKEASSTRAYLIEYLRALLMFTGWLLILYARNRYRVIHVHNMPDFLIFCALIPRLFGARLILDIHDPMPEFYMSKYAEPRPDRPVIRLMRWQERLSAALAHAVITANSNFKRNLIVRGVHADKITVVNNLPDTTIFSHNPVTRDTHDDFVLIYPGTIAPRYGLHVAVQAIPLLISAIPNVRLRIIGGRNDYSDELQALARDLGVSEHLEILPAVPIAAVPVHLQRADIGIYPALPDPHMSIATPSKVLEFAFMGLPVIASRLDVLVDMLPEQSVLFVEPGNAQSFAKAVLDLYRDPARRADLVKTMDSGFVKQRTWEKEAAVYKAVLAPWLSGFPDGRQPMAENQGRSEPIERHL